MTADTTSGHRLISPRGASQLAYITERVITIMLAEEY
jgi:hypothetical protein